MSLARVVISGVLESEPERRFTPNNIAVTNFQLAVQPVARAGASPEAPYLVKIVCWRGMADVAADNLHKGQNVLIEGRLMLNTSQTPEGAQKKSFEIDAAAIDVLPGQPQLLVPVGGTQGSNAASGNGQGFREDRPRTSAPGPSPASAPASGFSAGQYPASANHDFAGSGDLLTEDDIPF